MTDQTETTLYEHAPTRGLGFGFYTAEVTAADTVTLDNFDKIIVAICVKLEDNSEVVVTLATNVVTIPAGPNSDRVMIGVIGI